MLEKTDEEIIRKIKLSLTSDANINDKPKEGKATSYLVSWEADRYFSMLYGQNDIIIHQNELIRRQNEEIIIQLKKLNEKL